MLTIRMGTSRIYYIRMDWVVPIITRKHWEVLQSKVRSILEGILWPEENLWNKDGHEQWCVRCYFSLRIICRWSSQFAFYKPFIVKGIERRNQARKK